MEKRIKEYAKKHQIPIYAVEDDHLEYPNEIEW